MGRCNKFPETKAFELFVSGALLRKKVKNLRTALRVD